MDPQTQALDTIFLVFSFLLGSTVGSFLNVCVYRIPKGLSVVRPRSSCPKCGSGIAWHDNIPILSWLILGAKCRNCDQPISWQYPLVEGITGGLFLLVYWRFGFVLATPIYMLLAAALVLVTFVDLTDWTIPDEISLPGIPIGLACSLVAMYFPGSALTVLGPWEPIFSALAGAVVGGAIPYILDKAALFLLKKPGMGFGDVKLAAMLGAFFGLYGIFLVITIAAFLGSILGVVLIVLNKKTELPDGEEGTVSGHYLPFGPYLAVAGVIVMLFGADIINFYVATLSIEPMY